MDFIKILKKPKNADLVNKAVQTEALLSAYAFGVGFNSLVLSKYKDLMVEELHSQIDNTFVNYTKHLLGTNVGTVYSHFLNIFKSLEGKTLNISISNSFEGDFLNYLDSAFMNDLDLTTFVKQYLFEDLLYFPNTRYLIDFENISLASGEFDYSLPKIKRFTADTIFDLKEENGVLEYIIFKIRIETENANEKKYKYLCVDSEKYELYNYTNVFTLEKSVAHRFGFVPAIAASNAYALPQKTEIRKSVLTEYLDKYFDYTVAANQDLRFFMQNQNALHFSVSNDCKEVYQNYPCDKGYHNVVTFPQDSNGQDIVSEKPIIKRVRCKACERRKQEKNRFGKTVEFNYKDVVAKPEIVSYLKDAFGFVATDVEMLNHSKERVEDLQKDIEQRIMGRALTQDLTREAINEQQVSLANQNREDTLLQFATQLANAETKIIDLLGKARYGDAYYYTFVSYGTTFLMPKDVLYNELLLLRESGASQAQIATKQKQIVARESNHSFEEVESFDILNAVIPLQDVALNDVISNYEAYLLTIGEDNLKFRIYATSLIAYFEKELKTILFNTPASFEQRVKTTKAAFQKFVQTLNS